MFCSFQGLRYAIEIGDQESSRSRSPFDIWDFVIHNVSVKGAKR
ncbi:hypothetical protein LEP1GSC048_0672 [Leptospira santarosai serovar Shermani str. 1342KT]|nr:hypothetical protein LEP1GSC048_0672 [Leptospira santarosai serovar Shermani str. 1342KT]